MGHPTGATGVWILGVASGEPGQEVRRKDRVGWGVPSAPLDGVAPGWPPTSSADPRFELREGILPIPVLCP